MNYITGQTIRMLRERKQLTQRELAERLFISDKTVSRWESGRGLPDSTQVPSMRLEHSFRASCFAFCVSCLSV